MPILTVIAGPNGSGKSTLIEQLNSHGLRLGTYINADDIARNANLNGEKGSKEAQRRADALRAECLAAGADFSFETVMSHPSKIEFMHLAKQNGYSVVLYFICTSTPDINLRRVSRRVIFGGHDVPPDRVVARYHRVLDLLPEAIRIADRSVLFDNSQNYETTISLFRLVAEIQQPSHGKFIFNLRPELPTWCKSALLKLGARLG